MNYDVRSTKIISSKNFSLVNFPKWKFSIFSAEFLLFPKIYTKRGRLNRQMLVPRRIQKVKSSNDWYEKCILKCNPLLSINAMNKTYWHPRLWQEMCMLEMHNRSLSRYFCHSFLVYAVCLKASVQISFSRQHCCRRQLVWVCRRQFEVMVPLNSKCSWRAFIDITVSFSAVYCSI